jgi:hypothetical protein
MSFDLMGHRKLVLTSSIIIEFSLSFSTLLKYGCSFSVGLCYFLLKVAVQGLDFMAHPLYIQYIQYNDISYILKFLTCRPIINTPKQNDMMNRT